MRKDAKGQSSAMNASLSAAAATAQANERTKQQSAAAEAAAAAATTAQNQQDVYSAGGIQIPEEKAEGTLAQLDEEKEAKEIAMIPVRPSLSNPADNNFYQQSDEAIKRSYN